MTFQIETTCPACDTPITVDVLHEPEQRGGMEVEYLPEYLGIETDAPCECGHVITRYEEEMMLRAHQRSF
jgi:hypothetical protein